MDDWDKELDSMLKHGPMFIRTVWALVLLALLTFWVGVIVVIYLLVKHFG